MVKADSGRCTRNPGKGTLKALTTGVPLPEIFVSPAHPFRANTTKITTQGTVTNPEAAVPPFKLANIPAKIHLTFTHHQDTDASSPQTSSSTAS
jgi:hypothetical protein